MKKNDDCAWCIGFWVAIGVFILWLLTLVGLPFIITKSADRGQFGDMFGSINALFSGLAFVGVIVAILLQKEELEEQRKELSLTRSEFKDQNETMKKQRFENTFFNMMNLHNENVKSFELALTPRDYKGKDALNHIGLELHRRWTNNLTPNHTLGMRDVYTFVYQSRGIVLGHYFRGMYRIVKFVDESDISEEDKQNYIKILRAQLSDRELVLMCYNCGYYPEGRKFKDYVEKYALLNNMTFSMFFDETHIQQYTPKAYGGEYPTKLT